MYYSLALLLQGFLYFKWTYRKSWKNYVFQKIVIASFDVHVQTFCGTIIFVHLYFVSAGEQNAIF